MKERKKRKGNRMPSIENPEDFLNPKRELYNAIIQVFIELKNEPLKTRELRYLLLKNHGLKFHSKLSKRVIGERTLENYKSKFPDFDFNFKPQNLSNHLSTLTSENEKNENKRWEILRKDKEGYRLTKKGLALVENYGKKIIHNSFKDLLDYHPLKTSEIDFNGYSRFEILGFNEKELEYKYCTEIEKLIKEIKSSAMKIEGILTKAKYEHFISIVAHIYPDYEEWLEEEEKKRDPEGYEKRKKKFEKYLKAGKIPWFILKEKQRKGD